ncbi:hexapeptide repeat-containing transferase [Lactiplantibacillus paraplantarum]|uniref:Sugar O-acetyltransferase n=1 Tax=Lactiplantibacillus paraplantarum TaxID=60520 RepID=A0ABQ0N6X7_9LACO|nr:maltose acetyltransferase domain-containing protein [Lactiplantibacillus paraplantarum]ERL44209.1 hexapeptide repeat-containing transferase [Lactiplantibacillus paraplantarum]MCU4683791.1 hypothetical protein [Lactiplantibacillus paraplantarum]MDL2061275.1 maltose acetyltransferase domain-containing protein [Lactiplantibacillus paraplantarum]QJU49389.1 maltose O-acetyltransferase [Lactiplantibacillus paraplantarum]UKB41708.1 hypothetical protein L3503_00820 [Lactiplantibacillus paraplantaru
MTLTEHEKLLAGQDYDYRDPELQRLLARGKTLVQRMNTQTDAESRSRSIHELFHAAGQRVTINGHFEAIYGDHISVGDDVFINGNCYFQDSNRITLGNRVIIAPDTKFYCGQHSLDARKRFGIRSDGVVI